MENLGGWIISIVGIILAVWSIYSVKEFDKKEKHG